MNGGGEHLNQIVLLFVVGIPAIALFVWMILSGRSSKGAGAETDANELIDPSNDRQIGLLVGLVGGSIPDAAVVRFALQRFEEIHGRKATTRDAGLVAGLMKSAQ